jgi:hypothetical protein
MVFNFCNRERPLITGTGLLYLLKVEGPPSKTCWGRSEKAAASAMTLTMKKLKRGNSDMMGRRA